MLGCHGHSNYPSVHIRWRFFHQPKNYKVLYEKPAPSYELRVTGEIKNLKTS
jgi:hypothetical protein